METAVMSTSHETIKRKAAVRGVLDELERRGWNWNIYHARVERRRDAMFAVSRSLIDRLIAMGRHPEEIVSTLDACRHQEDVEELTTVVEQMEATGVQ